MNVGIVAQRGNARAAYLAAELRETLREMDVEVAVDAETAAAIDVEGIEPEKMSGFDLIVSIGGDGTFLFSAREVGDTPIVGVNLGEVGFLNAVSPGNAIEAVQSMVKQYRESGTIDERRVSRLVATGPGFTLDPAVNEIVVQGAQRGHGNGITIEVRVDGSLYTGGHADGVLVATPTGSTAYNLSEGGPLVSPGMDALVITEMCATESMPALVVDADSEVSIRVDDAPTAYAISDGRSRERFDPPGRIELTIDDTPLRIAGPESDFFEALGKLQ